MARSTYDNMAWSQDQLVRDIYGEIDDRPLDEIAESIMEVQGDRSFAEPKESQYLTREQDVEVQLLASHIVDWANYGTAYNDYSNPPWERESNPKAVKQLKAKLLR